MQVLPSECNLKGYNCQTRISFQGFEKARYLQQCVFFKKMPAMGLVRSRSGLYYTISFVRGTVNDGEAFSGKRDNGSVCQLRKCFLGNVFSPKVSKWDQKYDQRRWSHCLCLRLDYWAWPWEPIFQCVWPTFVFSVVAHSARFCLK